MVTSRHLQVYYLVREQRVVILHRLTGAVDDVLFAESDEFASGECMESLQNSSGGKGIAAPAPSLGVEGGIPMKQLALICCHSNQDYWGRFINLSRNIVFSGGGSTTDSALHLFMARIKQWSLTQYTSRRN